MAHTALSASAQTTQLVRVFNGLIGGIPANVCDARELHTYLENGDKFADWIKARVEKYGFQQDQDFACVSVNSETQRKNGQRGITKRIDYHLSLDMAKELSMVENNERGREARRYFIQKEREALANIGQHVPSAHTDALLPSEQQTLSEIVQRKAEPFGEHIGKAKAEIWSRLHNKFRVAKYSQLPRTQLADAILYVMQMQLRTAGGNTVEQPTPDAALEVLNAKDMNNLTRLVWLVCNRLHAESAWTQAVWYRLRQATGTPAPHRFKVRDLPILAEEVRRIFALTNALKAAQTEAACLLMKRVLRGGEPEEALLAQARQTLIDATQADEAALEQRLERWHDADIARLTAREQETYFGDYLIPFSETAGATGEAASGKTWSKQ